MHPLHHVLFLDVETVSARPGFDGLDDRGQSLWRQKIAYMARRDDHEWADEEYARAYTDRAAIYAEFGKVVVISAGFLTHDAAGETEMRIKSFHGHDEGAVLRDFAALLVKNFNNPNRHVLCGHNIREFDIPYLCRRMTVHAIPLPNVLQIAGKKPWEVRHLADTFEMWKFGDMKNFTSLDLLAYTLGIPSPKEDMDGSQVGRAYWEQDQLSEIRRYCERDVFTVAQVYLRLLGHEELKETQLIRIDE